MTQAPEAPESSASSQDQEPSSGFDPGHGNFMQFLGIVTLTLGVPFLLMGSTRTLGFVLCPIGAGLYAFGRFVNWYFWYRLQ